jgi:transposase InsO family protein
MGKQHREHIPKFRSTLSSRPLKLVHSDLCGPFPQPSLTGLRYILTFIDSRHYWVFFLATKNETFDLFKQFRQMVEKQIRQPLSCLHTDRGGEFISTAFNSYCKLHGIRRQLTAAGTPRQNNIAKHKNRHLYEAMRTPLHNASLPPLLWEEAIQTANYIGNRGPHKALHRSTSRTLHKYET